MGGEKSTESPPTENADHHNEQFARGPTAAASSTELLATRTGVEKYIERIAIGSRSIDIQWVEEQMSDGVVEGAQQNSIVVPWQPTTFRRKRELMQPSNGARPIRVEARAKLLGFIAKGRGWLDEILSDPTTKIETIAKREGMPERSARSILSLAFLAPDIVKGAIAGTLPRGFGVSRLIDLPANWDAQRIALGLTTPS